MSVYGLLVRSLATRGRVAAVASVASVVVLLGAVAGTRGGLERASVAYGVVNNLGIALLVPVTALVFASAALGDPSEDATLVYLWLSPVRRWRLVAAAVAAALTVAIPAAVVPVTATAALARSSPELVWAALASSTVAVVAYTVVFVGFGLVVRRALAWGLAYVLVWEGVVAGIGTGPARASVRHYARSVLSGISGNPPGAHEVSTLAGMLVPLAVAAVAFAITSWRLARQDVR